MMNCESSVAHEVQEQPSDLVLTHVTKCRPPPRTLKPYPADSAHYDKALAQATAPMGIYLCLWQRQHVPTKFFYPRFHDEPTAFCWTHLAADFFPTGTVLWWVNKSRTQVHCLAASTPENNEWAQKNLPLGKCTLKDLCDVAASQRAVNIFVDHPVDTTPAEWDKVDVWPTITVEVTSDSVRDTSKETIRLHVNGNLWKSLPIDSAWEIAADETLDGFQRAQCVFAPSGRMALDTVFKEEVTEMVKEFLRDHEVYVKFSIFNSEPFDFDDDDSDDDDFFGVPGFLGSGHGVAQRADNDCLNVMLGASPACHKVVIPPENAANAAEIVVRRLVFSLGWSFLRQKRTLESCFDMKWKDYAEEVTGDAATCQTCGDANALAILRDTGAGKNVVSWFRTLTFSEPTALKRRPKQEAKIAKTWPLDAHTTARLVRTLEALMKGSD